MSPKRVCVNCETEVVDSSSKRGYKFCPNCTTTRGRKDVKTVFVECHCCQTELPKDEESVAARKEAYESRLDAMEEKHAEEEGSGIAMVDEIGEWVDRSGISPRNLCVNCLEAGCRSDHGQIGVGCTYRMENTSPDECDEHNFMRRVYGKDKCRWCGLTRSES